MTREELSALHREMAAQALSLLEAKSQDYAHGDDPFSNFRMSVALGVRPEVGILLRCLDKFQRVRAFVERGDLKVKDESVKDSILDVMNYMVLLYGLVLSSPPEAHSVGGPTQEVAHDRHCDGFDV